MNRARIERERQRAEQHADSLKGLIGHEVNGPSTLLETYRRAEWFSLMRMLVLYDALLEEEQVPANLEPGRIEVARRPVTFEPGWLDQPLVCVRCDEVIAADGGMVQFGLCQRGAHFFTGAAHGGNCPVRLDASIA